MRAVIRDRYGRSDVVRVGTVPKPEPNDGEILVTVRAASVNTADIDHLHGRPWAARIGTGLRTPRSRVLGLDVAGVVEGVGPGVTEFAPGEEVWADMFAGGFGAFAEHVCAKQSVFAPKPIGVSFEDAATIPHSGVLAIQGLRGKGGVRAGQRVLINGAGGCVGPLAIQIAKSWGAEVTGVDHSGKLDLMRSAGADHVFDFTAEDVTRNGKRYDFILDIAANRGVLAYRRSLAPGGSYVHIARSLLGFFLAVILGGLASLFSSKRIGVFPWSPSRRQDLAELGRLLQEGELEPIIDQRYPIDLAPEALARIEQGEARGKLVIVM